MTTTRKPTPAQRRFMADVSAHGGFPTVSTSPTVIRNCHEAEWTTVGRDGSTTVTAKGQAAMKVTR